MDKPTSVEGYWSQICICRHERRAHGIYGCVGIDGVCPCDSFDLSDDQHVTHVFVGTIDQVAEGIRALGQDDEGQP